jgi:AcrR family transcriptional regulator
VVDARVLRSKAKIREAFVNLLQNQELKDVTVQAVSEASGVGYSTFYRHYATREMLIAEIAEFEVNHIFEMTYPSLMSGPAIEVCRVFAHHVESRRLLWTALTSVMASSILREKIVAGMLKFADRNSIGSGFLPIDLSASLSGTILVELLTWWLRQTTSRSPDYLAEAIDRVLIEPVFKCW